MPEGAVFGPYDWPIKVATDELVDFLEDVLACVRESDSMEGRIAYEWSEERGIYNVAAFVRNGNSQGQGGAWVLQDNEAAQDAEDDRETDERDQLQALVDINNILMSTLAEEGIVLSDVNQARVEELAKAAKFE